jgi:hypothetical protein
VATRRGDIWSSGGVRTLKCCHSLLLLLLPGGDGEPMRREKITRVTNTHSKRHRLDRRELLGLFSAGIQMLDGLHAKFCQQADI